MTCDDHSGCTQDSCDAGTGCLYAPQPASGCRPAVKSILVLRNDADDRRDKAQFKWLNGTATALDFADPTASSDYALCVYDDTGLVYEAEVSAGGVCASKPCWSSTTAGYKYRDSTALHDGVSKVILNGHATDARAKAIIGGKGVDLTDPILPITGSITAQLINEETGMCLESRWSGPQILRNDADRLKAKAP